MLFTRFMCCTSLVNLNVKFIEFFSYPFTRKVLTIPKQSANKTFSYSLWQILRRDSQGDQQKKEEGSFADRFGTRKPDVTEEVYTSLMSGFFYFYLFR